MFLFASSTKNTFCKSRGFTLIELIIVLGIIAVISGIISSTFIESRRVQAVDRDAETVVEVIRSARSKTLSSQNASVYGVHIDSTSVTLFAGLTYVAGAMGNIVTQLTASEIIATTSLTGGGSDIVFKRLTGETNQNGTITIASSRIPKSRIITIFNTGMVEINN